MATLATAPESSTLQINIFDGSRQTIQPPTKILFTIKDGNQRREVWDYYASGTTFKVPFYDNFGDNYTVVAFTDGYEQAGFTPVKCSPRFRSVWISCYSRRAPALILPRRNGMRSLPAAPCFMEFWRMARRMTLRPATATPS